MHLYLLAPNGDESRTPISARTDRNGRWSIFGIAADDRNFSITVGHSNFVKMTFLPDGAPDGDGTGHRVDAADFFSDTAVLELIPAATAPIVPAVPSAGTTAERVGLLRENVDQAYTAYQQDPSVQRNWTAFVQIVHADLPQILDLIDADASFNAIDILQWIVDGRLLDAGAGKVSPLWERPRVIALLQDRFVKDPKIARICWVIGSSWNPEEAAPAALFDAVARQNPDRLARAYATYAAASFLMIRATNAELAENVPDDIRFGAGTTPAIRAQFDEVEAAGGSKALYAQAAERLRILSDQYADCPGDVSGSTPCGEIARGELDEIEHFTIGARAPDITAPDIRGQPLRMSDYRGRIVVLSFWGAWSGPSMQMMPMERRLAARTAGKPVALIGVNSDGDTEMSLAVAAKEGMTWPSFWNGDLGPDGPISKAWHVSSWPTVYVLDGDGVIRFKFSGYGGAPTERILNAVVDRLIASSHS
jgi:thiol-disulfide isomerase/thioredoxin